MALDLKPSTWFPACSLAANTFGLNTKDHANPSLAELTDAEANPTSGDARKIVYALLERAFQVYNSLPEADRPARMKVVKTGQLGGFNPVFAVQYNVTFQVACDGVEVLAE